MTSSRKYFLGFDIGGTTIRYVVLALDRNALRTKTYARAQLAMPRTRAQFLEALEAIVMHARAQFPIAGIGIGVPGPLNAARTKILIPPNAPQLKNLSLAEKLFKKFRVRTTLENDANCFVFAEALLGTGRGFSRVGGITVGTGVGGGLMSRGNIEFGAFGSAGEIGHVVVRAQGWRCSCGGTGHLEAYIGKKGFSRLTGGKDPILLEKKARRGDHRARNFFARAGWFLGLGIANLVNLWDPNVVVIGGGLSEAGTMLLEPARKTAVREIVSPESKKVKILKGTLGIWAGAIGACLVARNASR